jgi:hypothetical protein
MTGQHPTAGRGLFAGLQDVKHYNVDHGWAKRSQDQSRGLFSFLWSRYVFRSCAWYATTNWSGLREEHIVPRRIHSWDACLCYGYGYGYGHFML